MVLLASANKVSASRPAYYCMRPRAAVVPESLRRSLTVSTVIQVNVSSEQQTDGIGSSSTVCFGNGTLKETHGNGAVTLRFTNGDVKRSLPDGDTRVVTQNKGTSKQHTVLVCFVCSLAASTKKSKLLLGLPGANAVDEHGDNCAPCYPAGRVEYWYAQVQTWQTSLPGGVEVYHFASGQVEARHPSGIAEVRTVLISRGYDIIDRSAFRLLSSHQHGDVADAGFVPDRQCPASASGRVREPRGTVRSVTCKPHAVSRLAIDAWCRVPVLRDGLLRPVYSSSQLVCLLLSLRDVVAWYAACLVGIILRLPYG